MRQMVGVAAMLAAAASGGYVVKGPGDAALQDDVQVQLVEASPVPTPTSTVSSPLSDCRREIVIHKPLTDLVGLFGDPSAEYVISQQGRPDIPLPPGAIDDRMAEMTEAYVKAGTQKLYANVELALFDRDGYLKDTRVLPNLIVNNGRDLAIRMILGGPSIEGTSCPTVACGNYGGCANPAKFNYVGLGSSGTTAAATQTALSSEFTIGANYSRQQDVSPDTTGTPGQLKIIVSFGPDNPNGDNSILESALFNASSGGTMLARRTFGTVTKADQDTLQVTWTCTLS